MQLLYQPNRWSCLPTSAAMVFRVSLSDILKQIGHDGSEICWPSLAEPECRKGFHIEEVQEAALTFGLMLVPFTSSFEYAPDDQEHTLQYTFSRWKEVMNRYDGILLGRYKRTQKPHAVAWNSIERIIYDPCGPSITELQTYSVESFHAAIRA